MAPYHKDHLLVIPKRHTENILEVADEEIKDVYDLQKIGLRILQKLGYSNISLIVREGDLTGKSVSHLHYHLIPNVHMGDVDHAGMERTILTEEEIASTVSRIKSAIENH